MQMENYEIIVLDLDGTLTNRDKVITPKTKKALMELQEADPEIDISEYAHCGIGEIEEQTERCHTAESGTGVSDAPADGASAGCGQGGRHGHGH